MDGIRRVPERPNPRGGGEATPGVRVQRVVVRYFTKSMSR